MTFPTTHCLLVAALLAAAPAAQTVTASLRADTPLTLTSVAANTVTNTLPAGALPSSGFFQSAQPTSQATMSWSSFGGSSGTVANWEHSLVGVASAGPHDMVFEHTASSPTPVTIEITHSVQGFAGAVLPDIRIDVENDGIFDYFGSATFTFVSQQVIDTQGLDVRVRFLGNLLASGITSRLTVRVLPRNNLQVLPGGPGCVSGSYQVSPSFTGQGVYAGQLSPPIPGPAVLAIGVAAQPFFLNHSSLACLVYPRPDVVLPFWIGINHEIPLPPAVRPVDLWMQRIFLQGNELVSDSAFLVKAY